MADGTLWYIVLRCRIRFFIAMPRPDVDLKAARFVSDIMMGQDLVALLPKLNAWLRKDPAHRVALARYQAMEQILRQYLRCAQPSAGAEELRALLAFTVQQ
jgi:hypothetical protein